MPHPTPLPTRGDLRRPVRSATPRPQQPPSPQRPDQARGGPNASPTAARSATRTQESTDSPSSLRHTLLLKSSPLKVIGPITCNRLNLRTLSVARENSTSPRPSLPARDTKPPRSPQSASEEARRRPPTSHSPVSSRAGIHREAPSPGQISTTSAISGSLSDPSDESFFQA